MSNVAGLHLLCAPVYWRAQLPRTTMGLRKINTPAHGHHPDLHLGYRQTSDGTWYIEWRKTSYSLKPIAIRRAWDTEIQLIERIQALEERLRNPDAPRPVAELKLRPFNYKPPETT